MHNLISVQPRRYTRSSSVTIARPNFLFIHSIHQNVI